MQKHGVFLLGDFHSKFRLTQICFVILSIHHQAAWPPSYKAHRAKEHQMISLPAVSASTVAASNLTTQRIVTSQRGSWRWQDAYRIATYAPAMLKDGRIVWQSQGRSAKYSWPQLTGRGYTTSLQQGSLHNKPLSADQLAQIAQ